MATTTQPAMRRRSLLAAALMLPLSACGDDEAAQRKAFIAFLQTRIIDKPGVHLAIPTAEEEKSWGEYTKHYAVIRSFNDALSNRVSKPMQDAAQRGNVSSLAELVSRRTDLQDVQRGMADLGAELDRQLATAETARAALKQPADLKPVYDLAYDRDVAGPARVFKEILPTIQDALAAALALSDLLAQNQTRIKLDGPTIQVTDPSLLKEVQVRMAAMNAKGQQVMAAQQKLRGLIAGS